MSEERRKRKQEREGISPSDGKSRKKLFIWGGIVLVLASAFYASWYHQNHKYDAFAKCLATKNAKMYGLFWCPHCIEQKQMFGESFHYVPYVECAISTREMTPQCKILGVKEFPSWQFSGEEPKPGVLSLDALSDKTGCSLP